MLEEIGGAVPLLHLALVRAGRGDAGRLQILGIVDADKDSYFHSPRNRADLLRFAGALD